MTTFMEGSCVEQTQDINIHDTDIEAGDNIIINDHSVEGGFVKQMQDNNLQDSGHTNQVESHMSKKEWVIDFAKIIQENSNLPKTGLRHVFEFPRTMRKYDLESFPPMCLSLGPYYKDHPNVKFAQQQKFCCLKYVLRTNRTRELSAYMYELVKLEEKARDCYPQKLKIERKDFLEMLLLDGTWILCYLCAVADPSNREYALIQWPHLEMISEASPIRRDIFLVNNQVPFFVIEKINEIYMGPTYGPMYARRHAAKSVEALMSLYVDTDQFNESNRPTDFHHLLHACHMYLKPKSLDNQTITPCMTNKLRECRSVTEFSGAGILFKRKMFGKNGARSILDITFNNNTLEIPRLFIHDGTTSLIRNLVLFEQANPELATYFRNYCEFMSSLIRTTEDVVILMNNNIIIHKHGTADEVVRFFNWISNGIHCILNEGCYLDYVYESLEKRGASFKRNHFRNPWVFIALFGMVVIVAFTLWRSVCAYLTYKSER